MVKVVAAVVGALVGVIACGLIMAIGAVVVAGHGESTPATPVRASSTVPGPPS